MLRMMKTLMIYKNNIYSEQIKNKVDFKNNIKNWNAVFESRNKLISYYWNSGNVGNKIIDLEISLDD